MKREYLPIGSVVLLKNTKKRLMITGFYVKPNESDLYFDYLGCIYPEGMVSEHENYIFNNEQIDKVFYKGLVDEEEIEFKEKLYEIIDDLEASERDNTVISIPVDLYNSYNSKENDIISIPLDEYNKEVGNVISIPADLYAEACKESTSSSSVISIPAEMYEKYNQEEDGKISIPLDAYLEETGSNVISIPLDEYEKELESKTICIPFEAYKELNEEKISIPLSEYEKLKRSRSVISINAKTYEDFLARENNIISIPADEYKKELESKTISIPLSAYQRLQDKEKEETISIPLDVYEKMMKEENKEVISISLDEYKKLTKGTEEDGIITLPSSAYNEILRKEKSGIDTTEKEIIEIPYDMYRNINVEDN